MTDLVAALPMYDWPETRAQTDAEWARFRVMLESVGIDAPARLVRRNADLPPVPGGIRDREGRLIAPDPATLPPDELDFPTLWKHPKLLLAQTCWGPMEFGLAEHVAVVGQPSYDGIEGGEGIFYSSAILARKSDAPPSVLPAFSPSRGEIGSCSAGRPEGGVRGVPAPADGRAVLPLNLMRGRRFAYNSDDSMSGRIGIQRDLEAAGEGMALFSELIRTGGHRASIVAVAEGRMDVCAVDCRSWKLARRHEPRAADLVAAGWTARRKGLPMITSVHTPPEAVAGLKAVLAR